METKIGAPAIYSRQLGKIMDTMDTFMKFYQDFGLFAPA